MTLYHYGNYLTDTGRLEQAAACLDEAREILQRIGVPTGFMERSQPGEAEEEN
jgi:hypothetical protein